MLSVLQTRKAAPIVSSVAELVLEYEYGKHCVSIMEIGMFIHNSYIPIAA